MFITNSYKRIRKSILITFLLSLFAVAGAFAQTPVTANITQNTTWTKGGSPYTVTGDIAVNSGKTLTIKPGVKVIFSPGSSLSIGDVNGGAIDARGTAGEEIIFTGQTKEPGSWKGLSLVRKTGESIMVLEHCKIEYGVNGIFVRRGVDARLSNCTIVNNSGHGISTDMNTRVTVEDSTISNNGQSGVFNNNSVGSNGISGVYSQYVELTVRRNRVESNNGPGINLYVRHSSRQSFTKLDLTANTIRANGSGLFLSHSDCSIRNNKIIDNSGDAIHSDINSTITNLSGNSVTGNGTNDIRISGSGANIHSRNLCRPLTWEKQNNLDIVVTDKVELGDILTIKSGVKVYFTKEGYFQVGNGSYKGALRTEGLSNEEVILTGLTPGRGSWPGIRTYNDSPEMKTVLEYCRIENAATGLKLGSATDAVLRNSTIVNSLNDGIWADFNTNLTVENSLITGNGKNGIYSSNGIHPYILGGIYSQFLNLTIKGATIENNREAGIYLYGINYSLSGFCDFNLTGSTIRNNGAAGIFLSRATSSIRNNRITGNGGFAIHSDINSTVTNLSGNTVTGNKTDDIRIRGNKEELQRPVTWEKQDNLPMVITEPLTLRKALTINAGVKLHFTGEGGEFKVSTSNNLPMGALKVQGNATEKVLFAGLTAVPGSWKGLIISGNSPTNGDNVILEHCRIENAVNGLSAKWGVNVQLLESTIINSSENGILADSNTNVKVENSFIRDSGKNGIYSNNNVTPSLLGSIQNQYVNLTVRGTTIENSGNSGIYLYRHQWSWTYSKAILTGNTIRKNEKNGIYLTFSDCSIRDNIIEDNFGIAINADINSTITKVSGNKVTKNKYNDIRIRGYINISDQLYRPITWEKQDNLDIVVTDVIKIYKLLTVKPGVTVNFTEKGRFIIGSGDGGLKAVGSEAEPIIFRGLNPIPGSWPGIVIYSTGNDNTLLEYCRIEYAQSGLYLDTSKKVPLTNCAIENNLTGIYYRNNGPLLLNNCIIGNNSNLGIQNSANLEIDARSVYWGHPSGPFHTVKNQRGQGNAVSNNVLFSPWQVIIPAENNIDKQAIVLQPGVPYRGELERFEIDKFIFHADQGKALLVKVEGAGGNETLQLEAFNSSLRIKEKNLKGLYELPIQPTLKKSYNFSLSGRNIPQAGSAYTITALYVDGPYITDVIPRRAPKGGTNTLSVIGLNLTEQTRVSLRATNAPDITAGPHRALSSTRLLADFSFINSPIGNYSVVVKDEINRVDTLENGFSVTGEELRQVVSVKMDTPRWSRPARKYVAWVEYTNDGNTDMPAPLLSISNNGNAPMRLSKSKSFQYGSLQFLAVNHKGKAGMLTAGQTSRIPVYFRVPENCGPHFIFEFTVQKAKSNGEPINWITFSSGLKPAGVNEAAWLHVLENFQAQIGPNLDDYSKMLADNAAYLSAYRRVGSSILVGDRFITDKIQDSHTNDINRLIQFEMAKAMNSLPTMSPTLSAVDLTVAAPELAPTFGRSLYSNMIGRFTEGPMGRGWYHNWEYSFSKDEQGNVTIKRPGDYGGRTFMKLKYGGYHSGSSDRGVLTAEGSDYLLTEVNGLVYRFNTLGELTSVENRKGYSLSFLYSGKDLSRIEHSTGAYIEIEYNGNRISTVRSSDGQVVNYTHQGGYLVSSEKSGSRTTRYAYHLDDGTARSHALTEVTTADTRKYLFKYNERGRLIQEGPEGTTEQIYYSFEAPGTVIIKDSLNNSATYRLGTGGEVLQYVDPEGKKTVYIYDENNRPAGIITPDGKTINNATDSKGRINGIMSPLGDITRFSYSDSYDRLTRMKDARGNALDYSYNSSGDLTGISYPDGTAQSYLYDTKGFIQEYTNRRQQKISYTSNSLGQIEQKLYPDGRTVTYTYNPKGLLERAVDSVTGEIKISYDSRSFMESISYPGGYGFRFTYDNAGRRLSRKNLDGSNELRYSYTKAGRLESVTDAGGSPYVTYIYNNGGQLVEEQKGNSTKTTYKYNKSGLMFEVINYAAGGSLLSSFTYTYDDAGRRISAKTLSAEISYIYDDSGQLIEERYSTGRTISYNYDAVGNRIAVTENGIVESYTTNSMNQYLSAGSGSFLYDDDGNLTGSSTVRGNYTYSYDIENRLVKVDGPNGDSWSYSYDALGNRMESTFNGQATRFVLDPAGLGSVAAEYDNTGALKASYIHGLGLISATAAGKATYYSYDGQGNTSELTDGAGQFMTGYSYTAYGQTETRGAVSGNSYRYSGRYGVSEEAHGLHYMRARYYDAYLGRFAAQDPIGINAGDVNIYRYCGNDPVNFVDPSGLFSMAQAAINACGYVGTGIGMYLGKHAGMLLFPDDPGLQDISGWIGGGIGGCIGAGLAWLAIKETQIFLIYSGIGGLFTTFYMSGLLIGYCIDRIFEEPIDNWFDDLVELKEITTWEDIKYLFKFPENLTPDDPNMKTATPGTGTEHFINPGEQLDYVIFFENKSSAPAPAQEVFIHDYLSEYLDWSTLELKEIGFADRTVSALNDLQRGKTTVLHEDLAVDINVDFYPDKGYIFWTFRSLDPETGDYPADPWAGFLPPEDGKGSGQGYVSFTIKARSDLAPRTVIKNSASIIFDTNGAIETNEVFNTIFSKDKPLAPTTPVTPAAGSKDVSLLIALEWAPAAYTASYDLYLWPAGEARPEQPFASDVKGTSFRSLESLDHGTVYNWQVVAKNIHGETAGPVWSFTTEAYRGLMGDVNSDGAVTLADAKSIAGFALGFQVPGFIKAAADLNGDGKINMTDALLAGRIATGLAK